MLTEKKFVEVTILKDLSYVKFFILAVCTIFGTRFLKNTRTFLYFTSDSCWKLTYLPLHVFPRLLQHKITANAAVNSDIHT